MKLRKIFKSKTIVFPFALQPGLLLKTFEYKGKRFARIAFTNKVKYKGTWPVTDVEFKDIVFFRKYPSPFKTWLWKQFGKEAKFKTIILKK